MRADPPHPAATAYDWLARAARERPDARAISCWRDRRTVRSYSFRALKDLVDEWAAILIASGVRPGERVLLVLPNDESFTCLLLAAIRIGAIAVPGPAPDNGHAESVNGRLRGILTDCRPRLVVTRGEWQVVLAPALGDADAGLGVLCWESAAMPTGEITMPSQRPADHDPAIIQYTSGSTGDPRGVVITHRMLRASCAQAAQVYAERSDDVAVTWVPLSHDMGLVTGVLRPLFSGYESVLMSPREFVRSPVSWLLALTASGGTLSSAPDFAYARCVRRISEVELDSLDLSRWRVARNAGEMIRDATATDFIHRFEAASFSARAFCPSYGMAEATLTVATSSPECPALRLEVDRGELELGRISPVVEPAPLDRPTRILLSSGVPLPGTSIRVKSAESGQVGELFVRGPQLFSGYWPGDESTPSWHRTGDRGFLYSGHVFVTGRSDDVVIVRGRQFYSADVAAACTSVSGLRPGRCAAISLESGVHLLAEVEPGMPQDAATGLSTSLRRRLAQSLDLYVTDVVLLAAGELPVTTSGKLRFGEIHRRFVGGSLRPFGSR